MRIVKIIYHNVGIFGSVITVLKLDVRILKSDIEVQKSAVEVFKLA